MIIPKEREHLAGDLIKMLNGEEIDEVSSFWLLIMTFKNNYFKDSCLNH